MQDYVFAETRQIGEHERFAVFDGYESQELPKYLKDNLFNNILKQPTFLFNPKLAVQEGYQLTDATITAVK